MCEQQGGKNTRKRYDKSSDSDSDSDSSSSMCYPSLIKTSPIALFHYNPYMYYNHSSILNPELVAVSTPIFTPIFKPTLGTFIGLWP